MSFKSSGTKTRPQQVKPPQPPAQAQSRRSSDASSVASFHSAHFPPEEEARLVSASNDLKAIANAQFAKQDYSSAISTYDKAAAECPSYLDYELAVLSSNIAACHLRLEEWRNALQAAERGMEGLETLMPLPKDEKKRDSKGSDKERQKHSDSTTVTEDNSQIIELPEGTTDADDERLLEDLNLSDQRKADIHRIRTKLLLRRARARYMLGMNTTTSPEVDQAKPKQATEAFGSSSAWSNLSSAHADYQLLSTPAYFSTLPNSDKKTIQNALVALPPIIEKAKEQEVGEMMGKLKELGNGILKPFGLSTDMFKMEKDEKSGGMSLRFDGGGKK